MKIYRTELESEIQEKLFDIDVDQLKLDTINCYSKKVDGIISVNRIQKGYHIKGSLKVPYLLTCDRCLVEFKELKRIKFDFILSDNNELKFDESDDIFYFPISEIEFDPKPLFRELIQLGIEMKILCEKDCKGLCSICGTNLNDSQCDCSNPATSSPWDVLKDFNRN